MARQRVSPIDRAMRARGRDRVLGFFALLVMLLIVGGIPAGLVYFVGWPLPHKMPQSSDFTSQVDWETIVKAIACVIWLLWLQLVWCLLIELKAGVRGRGMAGHVPMSGASQDLARRLVGAFLLLMTASGQLTHLGAGGHTAPRAAAVASVPQVSLGDMYSQQAPQAPERAIQASPMPGLYAATQQGGGGGQAVTTQADATVTKVYVVKSPQGGYHDNLWDIAERHLGNPLRYHEIYDLNKDHVQPGGGQLTKESLIQPGWRLVMPADATGADLIIEGQTAPPAVQQQAPTPAEHHQQAHTNPADAPVLDAVYARGGGGDTGGDTGGGLSSRPGTSSAMEQIRALADSPTRDARWALVGGELLAFGLMEALVGARRRQARRARPGERLPRPEQGAAGLEAAMRLRADAAGSEFLGQATRALAAGLAAEGKAVPQFYAVRLAGDVLEFWLTPARLDPPAPFVPENEGNTWVVHRAALPDEPIDAPAPLPGLVCLGDDERGRVLVDLEAAEGLIGVDGPPERVQALLASLAAELATNSWSDGLRLVLVGFGAEMAGLAPDRALVTDDLNAVLDELEARAATITHALGTGADGSVMNGRVRGNAQYYLPDYVLVGTAPGDAALDRLRALSRRARGAFGVVVAGDVPGATWRFTLGRDGMLDTGPLGLRLRAQQLPREAYGALAGLLHAANAETGPPAGAEDGGQAARHARSEPAPSRVPVVAPPALDPDQPPGLFVRIFGAPDVFGPPDFAAGTPLTVEIAAYLALHADGVSEQALGAAIWPRGARAAEKTAALRQVGEWLGLDQQGQPRLGTLPDGRLRLTGDVRLDWYQFNALVGRSAPGDLERAVELLRGPVAADRAAGRYSWLAQEAIEYDAPVLAADACHRLVVQAAGADDLDLATHAARQGLAIDPLATLLWKDLIKIERIRNGDAGARVVVEEMAQAIRASGTDELEADVETLLRTFAPQTAPAARPVRRKPVIVAVAA